MILVTGVSQHVGRQLVPELVAQGAPVRALTHSASSREQVERDGAEAVDGDFDQPDTLERALEGCDRLFLLSPASPQLAVREKRAVDIATRAGVDHIVALSAVGASPQSPAPFARWHADVDAHLAGCGSAYTILQPAAFMQLHLLPVVSITRDGTWYGMTGDGAHGFVDAGDVAAVAAHVLTTSGHAGATYELTGPAAITMPQAAAELAQVTGRDIRYVDLPAEQFRANLVGAGVPDWLADSLVALYGAIRAGHAATVTNEVEKATGRPARAYREFAEDNTDALAVPGA